MRKKLFLIILCFVGVLEVQAFRVNVDEIEIGKKTEELVDNLNKAYKIDIQEFDKSCERTDEKLEYFIKELSKITLDKDSKDSKKVKLTKYQYYSNDNGGETLATAILIDTYLNRLEELKIEASYIREIRTVPFNENDYLSFVYLGDSVVDGKSDKVILMFWLKKVNDSYSLFYPWLTIGHDISEYYAKVAENEDTGIIDSGTYKSLTLSSDVHEISTDDVKKVYQDNVNSVVQITAMNENGVSVYGSGFFIREGVVVTTWSKFLQFLTNGDFIYVNDTVGKTYQVLGVIAAQVDYDVVVLKVNESSGKPVSFSDSKKLTLDDSLFIISSKNNTGFSISYGSYVTENNGKMRNMLLLNDSDVGAALFDKNGKVVGMAVGDKVNSDLSYANSTNYLVRLQNILSSQTFEKISYTKLDVFKESYYKKMDGEKTYNYVSNKVWDSFKKIGNIEENIELDLVKSSYVDKILSLRYKCDTKNMVDTLFLTSSYTEQLVMDGYRLTYEDEYKRIYQNNKYKIIIKSNLHYLIILIMEN